ncbi:nucleoside-diphosphate-sugar epimerase [Loktanella ponticola]|uniref:Nucleoside-diphosphate-sugar epimerase n=1 Tax=Yoonia ponticola TaxID=1524255 RepID=A0A7W9F150_9RHOB|nr:NAD-dependent epimerase/dehydratase family protein [Yoonia ponticola]MBB5723611.1 nucleoside-diphosphate-sugar epimerase [Yoonia ponticola]
MTTGPLILGASSRVGRMLHRLWVQGALDFGGVPVWQYRKDAPDQADQKIIWDMLADAAPDIAVSGVICLAGPTSGPDLDLNRDLALAAADVADGAPLLFASTQAVYGPQSGVLSESSPCQPAAYGAAKLDAEAVLRDLPNATSLRVANAIGADALLMAAARGPVTLDRFADGQSPKRMMIGPRALGQAFADLLALGDFAAPVLNLAQPGLVAMADMLVAADHRWTWQDAPATAIPSLELDITKVQRLITLPPADPMQLVAEARLAGWGA